MHEAEEHPPRFLDRPAPSGRADTVTLRRELHDLLANPVVDALMETAEELFAILNSQRQILMVNNCFLELAGIDDPASVHGLRVGEAVGCPRAGAGPDGCGTGVACQTCGAAVAMVLGAAAGEAEQTCCLQRQTAHGLEDLYLTVRCRPLVVAGESYLLLFMRNVSAEQERCLLERSFVHDISNIIGVLAGQGDLLDLSSDPQRRIDLAGEIRSTALRLAREVALHRAIIQGASVTGIMDLVDIDLLDNLKALVATYRGHRLGHERTITVRSVDQPVIRSDPVLLDRVVGNLLQNALEASAAGETIAITAGNAGGRVEVTVWNQAVIPPAIKARIFQRNFSSKGGLGRGLGTTMAKRIAEQLLHGSLTCSSETGKGTTFTLSLPATVADPCPDRH